MKFAQTLFVSWTKRTKFIERGGGCWEFLVFVVILILTWTIFDRFMIQMTRCQPPKDREGQSNVAAMNRGQQAYWLNNRKFAGSVESLQLGISDETENYVMTLEVQGDVVFHYAQSKKPEIRSHVGAVVIQKVSEHRISEAILCTELRETLEDSIPITEQKPTIQDGVIICASTTKLS